MRISSGEFALGGNQRWQSTGAADRLRLASLSDSFDGGEKEHNYGDKGPFFSPTKSNTLHLQLFVRGWGNTKQNWRVIGEVSERMNNAQLLMSAADAGKCTSKQWREQQRHCNFKGGCRWRRRQVAPHAHAESTKKNNHFKMTNATRFG